MTRAFPGRALGAVLPGLPMRLRETFKANRLVGVDALRIHPLRTLLSVLGIMIGCAALSFVAALVMHRYDGRILADLSSDGRPA